MPSLAALRVAPIALLVACSGLTMRGQNAPKRPEVVAPPTSAPPTLGIALPPEGVPPEVYVMPSAPVPVDGKPCLDCTPAAPAEKPIDWSKVPVVTNPANPGLFVVPPTGPGYYTFFDYLHGDLRDKPPKFPFGTTALNGRSTFEYDFRYLEDPKNRQFDWSDVYKRIHVGDDFLFSTGGEVRVQHQSINNARLTGLNNHFNLLRTRVYGDAWYRDDFRVFVEYLDAQSSDQMLEPLPQDINRSDLLNAFVEFKAGEANGAPIQIRAGRQEVTYGSQRLFTSPEWNNNRRNFQGVKGFWHGEKWNFDAFWFNPVVVDFKRFDSVDTRRSVFGGWATYKPRPGDTIDLYYLGLNNNLLPETRGDVHTLGARSAGDRMGGRILYDFEGFFQFGRRGVNAVPIDAKGFAAEVGYHFKDCYWNPIVWAGYDYASGNRQGDGNSFNTFNQLFPFGHYYFGAIDVVGRQNIHDLYFQGSVNPTNWITGIAQYHVFRLDEQTDALYSAQGIPIRRSPDGRAGDQVGSEIDLLANFTVSQHQTFLVGYSHLFAGQFIKKTAAIETGKDDIDFAYVQYNIRW